MCPWRRWQCSWLLFALSLHSLWTMGFAQGAFAFFSAPLSEAWSTAGCFACLAASKLPSLHKLIYVFPSLNTFRFIHRGAPAQLRVNTCSLQFTLPIHLSYLLTYSFFIIACKTFGRHFLNFPKFIDFLVRQSVRWIWCSAPEQNAISRSPLCLAPLQGLQWLGSLLLSPFLGLKGLAGH